MKEEEDKERREGREQEREEMRDGDERCEMREEKQDKGARGIGPRFKNTASLYIMNSNGVKPGRARLNLSDGYGRHDHPPSVQLRVRGCASVNRKIPVRKVA
jgi:hypothetical protein